MAENGYYYYLGEAYYPTYITTRDAFGGVYTMFSGYFYTHAVLVKFDNQEILCGTTASRWSLAKSLSL